MEAQVSLIAAFRSSALLGLVSLIFLLTISHRFCWPIKHSNTMVIEPAFGTFGSVGRCQVLLENEISISHKACQQKEAWSALKFPGRWLRWLWTSENSYPLSTSRNQVLVQSQCYCQFLVGSTGEPFKNRLLFHWLESQYRARTYVTEYVSCFVSLARLRQTQQTCSRCIAPRRSIGTQHTEAPRERSKSIKSRQLSSRSRSTPMPRTERSA